MTSQNKGMCSGKQPSRLRANTKEIVNFDFAKQFLNGKKKRRSFLMTCAQLLLRRMLHNLMASLHSSRRVDPVTCKAAKLTHEWQCKISWNPYQITIFETNKTSHRLVCIRAFESQVKIKFLFPNKFKCSFLLIKSTVEVFHIVWFDTDLSYTHTLDFV